MPGPLLPDGYDVAASFLTRCRGSHHLRPRRCADVFGLWLRHRPPEHLTCFFSLTLWRCFSRAVAAGVSRSFPHHVHVLTLSSLCSPQVSSAFSSHDDDVVLGVFYSHTSVSARLDSPVTPDVQWQPQLVLGFPVLRRRRRRQRTVESTRSGSQHKHRLPVSCRGLRTGRYSRASSCSLLPSSPPSA